MTKLASLMTMAMMCLSAQAATPSLNFQNVTIFSFSCESVSQQRSITGAEWNKDEAILRVFKDVSGQEEELEFEITKTFKGKSLIMLGQPIDGSEGNVQFILRDGKKSTVVVNSRGATKLNCSIELL